MDASNLGVLLRGEPQSLRAWIEHWNIRRSLFCATVIFFGAGFYGAAMGWWRAPLQALLVAIKFPLIILLTTLGNALLNAMLAPLLGLNISFRQSLLAILMSFTIASAILGSFSPLIAFLVWNVPPLSSEYRISDTTYGFIQVTHVVVIAFAGITANLRLFQLLNNFATEPVLPQQGSQQPRRRSAAAQRVLIAWLAGNLFLGSQLCWIFRPFIGSPGLPVEFLRPTPLKGSFYETVFHSATDLFKSR